MADWRKMEADLIRQLDAAGISVVYASGNAFAVVSSLSECGRPHACEAVFRNSGIVCHACDTHEELSGGLTSLDITKLAKSLAEQS